MSPERVAVKRMRGSALPMVVVASCAALLAYSSDNRTRVLSPQRAIATLRADASVVDPTGLIGLWHLDGDFLDSSGNGNDGSIYTGSPTPTTGIAGQAFSFDGNDGIQVGNLNFSGEKYTVNIWARTTAPAVTERWRQAITKGDLPPGGDMTFELFINDGRPPGENNPVYFVWDNGRSIVNIGITEPEVNARDGDWHMWTATYTNGSQKLYYDGCLFGSASYPGPLPLVTEPVIIGGFEGFGPFHHPWIGDLDEVSIYTRVLDPSEVAELYELYRTLRCGAPLCNGQPATIFGSDANDVLVGTEGDDVIAGLGGRDGISGLGGNDLICGGLGADVLEGQGGNDFVDGGSGNDQLIGDNGNDTLLGRGGADELFGGKGDDNLNGGAGSDFCVGATGSDTAVDCEAIQGVP